MLLMFTLVEYYWFIEYHQIIIIESINQLIIWSKMYLLYLFIIIIITIAIIIA